MSLIYNGTTIKAINYNGTAVKKVIFNGTTVWTASTSCYVIQNGSVVDWNYVQSADCNVYGQGFQGADEIDEEYNKTYNAYVLKNVSAFKTIRVTYQYRQYAEYGEKDVYFNGVRQSEDTWDWKRVTVDIPVSSGDLIGEVKIHAKHLSSAPAWSTEAWFQLLDIYLEL